jgi:hypothetical protein
MKITSLCTFRLNKFKTLRADVNKMADTKSWRARKAQCHTTAICAILIT